MNVVLGIDTSSTDLSVGIYIENRPLAFFCRFLGNSHAEHIVSAITNLLDASGIAETEISNIAISTGPGSFTGLRIGIAFVKGFCIGKDIKALPLSSLFILAHAAVNYEGRIAAAVDARNNEVYWALFNSCGGRIERLTPDTVTTFEPFAAMLTKKDIIVIDTIGYKKSTVFSPLKDKYRLHFVEDHPFNRGLICAAKGVEKLADHSMWTDATAIRPNYLRHWTSK